MPFFPQVPKLKKDRKICILNSEKRSQIYEVVNRKGFFDAIPEKDFGGKKRFGSEIEFLLGVLFVEMLHVIRS